jgi:hypothetical protein
MLTTSGSFFVILILITCAILLKMFINEISKLFAKFKIGRLIGMKVYRKDPLGDLKRQN